MPPPAWSQPVEPENKPANTGFALSMSAAGVLVFTVGALAVVALPLAIAGWVQGRRGVAMVERGETRKNEMLARSAVVVGMIATILSVLAIVALVIVIAEDPSWLHDSDGGER